MIELRRRYSGSKGSGSPSFSRLPAGYQEVEYLESTGGQWIETNIPASDGTDIKIDFQFTTYVQGSCLFGAYISNPDTRWYMHWRQEKQYNFGHGQDKNVSITNPYDRHVVEYITSNKEVKIDGTVVKNFSTTVNTGLNIWIFNCNDNYAGTFPIYAKVFSFYAETSTDKYDLVPCYRTSDRKPGMYDIVNDVFYVNQGTGEFLYGPDVHYNLPAEYQKVEYIQPKAIGAFIRTDVLFGEDTKTTIEFEFEENPSTDYSFVSGVLFGNTDQYAISKVYGSNTECYARSFYHPNSTMAYVRTSIVGKHLAVLHNDYVILDGEKSENFGNAPTADIYGYDLLLFACFQISTNKIINFSLCKISSVQIEQGGVLVRDLIPCYRKSDNVAGMYDIVEGKFYTNAGTGEFIVGPEIIG